MVRTHDKMINEPLGVGHHIHIPITLLFLVLRVIRRATMRGKTP